MKTAIICAVILSASIAGAQTKDIPAATPVTNFDNTPQPVDPTEQRAAINTLIQQLQSEYNELMTPQAGETPDQSALRQRQALAKLHRINRLKSKLLAIPVQSIELNK